MDGCEQEGGQRDRWTERREQEAADESGGESALNHVQASGHAASRTAALAGIRGIPSRCSEANSLPSSLKAATLPTQVEPSVEEGYL